VDINLDSSNDRIAGMALYGFYTGNLATYDRDRSLMRAVDAPDYCPGS
jgi:hypothetical protein